MRNANRDYFITLNAKNSTVTTGNLSFYITDKNTSNIFCQLIFNESNNQLINSYAPNENAEDYIITLRIVKPNNEPKEIRFSILSAPNFVYYVDLTDDYKDIIGTYECECFIDSTINGRLERNTTNSFTYTVKESIMSELDGLLEDLPSFPLIDNLATRDYVDKAVANGVGGEINLNNYATVANPVFTGSMSMDRAEDTVIGISSIALGARTAAEGYYSFAEGAASYAKGTASHAEGNGTWAYGHSSHSEGSGTKAYANYSHAEGYNTIASGDYSHVQGKYNIEDTNNKYAYIVGNGYFDNSATSVVRSNAHTLDWNGNAWFAGKVTAGSDPTENMDVATKQYVDNKIWIGTQTEYDAIITKDSNTVYIIKEG